MTKPFLGWFIHSCTIRKHTSLLRISLIAHCPTGFIITVVQFMPISQSRKAAKDRAIGEPLTAWQVSSLPSHDEALVEWYFPDGHFTGFQLGEESGPPFKGHRWLPLRPSDEYSLSVTPIAGSRYGDVSKSQWQWSIAAQEHYSFFQNLEEGRLDRYWNGNGEGLWNLHGLRYTNNFVAIWGKSVAAMPPRKGDEEDMYEHITKALNKREFYIPELYPFLTIIAALIDTHAIVSHFAFNMQHKELGSSDLLQRYSMYAKERIC